MFGAFLLLPFLDLVVLAKSVNSPFGVLNGRVVEVGGELPAVAQYLGVPYGVSPTGQHRFNMAISAAKWTHKPKDATQMAAVCVQSGFKHMSETEALQKTSAQRFDYIHRVLPYLKPQSEDCLYMNLYVPERLDDAINLSVLVVIHGSEYGWSSGNVINGSMLAASGQVIVVTLNYRLDVYGFLSRCEASACTGNAGLTDLVAALKMLSKILPAFGGDPQTVTLMGWGSGAALISLLMASPITQPNNRLFKRAILLDGTALSPSALSEYPQQYFMRIAEELKCVTNTPHNSKDMFNKETSHILRCIQEQSQINLTMAAQKIKAPTFTSAFAPIVDGQVVPNHPRFSFSPKFGSLFRDIDLLAGTVSHPSHHLLSHDDLSHGIHVEKRDKIIRTLVRNLFDFHRTEVFDAIVNEYTNWEEPANHSRSIRDSLLNILGDILYVAPLVETLRMHATDEASMSSNSFFFVFSHESTENEKRGVRGAISDEHVPYILGYPLLETNGKNIFDGFAGNDKDISKVMMTYVSNFVKTGDPSRPKMFSTQTTIEDRFHSVPWPQFNQATRESYLEISDRPRVKNFYRNSYVGFWNNYIPRLSKNKDERDRNVDEEHHFLPDHFNKQSFYGVVRPYSNLNNHPFPPPPMPPTPLPKDLKKLSTTIKPKPQVAPTEAAEASLKESNYNHIFVLAIVFGFAFIVINTCIYIAMYKLCQKNKSDTKKRPPYSPYTSAHGNPSEVTYIPNTPFSQQLLPPSQTALTGPDLPPMPSRNHSRDETSRASSFAYDSSANSIRHQHLPTGIFHDSQNNIQQKFNMQEQEPLLAGSSKSSTPALIRPGISPTCPRHGKAAQMMVSQSRANSVGTSMVVVPHLNHLTHNTPALEEVQV
ncbi:unnamed protein product [Bursaphelenchus okinawaensis]|uniref:Carboxylesterase type B domain-containing protein n=1 Tax=Bursaphelenchus okinawaensis TaxID=465554 RepID=A0A811LMI4_9BILA|nr:unnamed protein product [Bursaphelenchus okinawaensis]CAG9126289.1 unnamed protein product [Bursaphelenchus okinawaensis]